MYQILILAIFIGLEIIMMLLFFTIWRQQKAIQIIQNKFNNLNEDYRKTSEKKEDAEIRAAKYLTKILKFEKLFNSSAEYDAKTYIKKGRAILSDTPKHA